MWDVVNNKNKITRKKLAAYDLSDFTQYQIWNHNYNNRDSSWNNGIWSLRNIAGFGGLLGR